MWLCYFNMPSTRAFIKHSGAKLSSGANSRFCTACLSTFSNCYCRASRMRNTTCRCADSCSTWASRLQLNGEAERRNVGGRGEEFTTSCSWGGRAWSLHAWINPIKSALALYSPAPSLPPSTSPPLPFRPFNPPSLFMHPPPHHRIIVSGRATRLADT